MSKNNDVKIDKSANHMNKRDLINAVIAKLKASKTDSKIESKSEIEAVIDATFATIVESVERGQNVMLVNFANFIRVWREARQMKSPINQKVIITKAGWRLKIKPGKKLTDAAEGSPPPVN